MCIEEQFGFLVEEYGLTYQKQCFENCYNLNYHTETYSFYNDSGCFTIYKIFARELDFYFTPEFSTDYRTLVGKVVDITSIEPDIWNKRSRIWFIPKPLWWWSEKNILRTLAEVLKVHLAKGGDLFGVKI